MRACAGAGGSAVTRRKAARRREGVRRRQGGPWLAALSCRGQYRMLRAAARSRVQAPLAGAKGQRAPYQTPRVPARAAARAPRRPTQTDTPLGSPHAPMRKYRGAGPPQPCHHPFPPPRIAAVHLPSHPEAPTCWKTRAPKVKRERHRRLVAQGAAEGVLKAWRRRHTPCPARRPPACISTLPAAAHPAVHSASAGQAQTHRPGPVLLVPRQAGQPGCLKTLRASGGYPAAAAARQLACRRSCRPPCSTLPLPSPAAGWLQLASGTHLTSSRKAAWRFGALCGSRGATPGWELGSRPLTSNRLPASPLKPDPTPPVGSCPHANHTAGGMAAVCKGLDARPHGRKGQRLQPACMHGPGRRSGGMQSPAVGEIRRCAVAVQARPDGVRHTCWPPHHRFLTCRAWRRGPRRQRRAGTSLSCQRCCARAPATS